MLVEKRLQEAGLLLPEPIKTPPGMAIPFQWVRVYGDRAYISEHGPLAPDGTLAQPLGRVGQDLATEEGYAAARLATLAILASLQRTIGDLDRIAAWLTVPA